MTDGDLTFVLAGYLAAMALGGLLGALLVLVRGGQRAAPRRWSTGYEGRPVERLSDEPTELEGPPAAYLEANRPIRLRPTTLPRVTGR